MTVVIGHRIVGPGQPCYVIAEAGVNHNGDVAQAMALIDAAADAGADAVKFQTFRADAVAAAWAPKARYQLRTTGAAESQQAMLRRLELDATAHRALIAHARRRGIDFLSSPFDPASVGLLVEMGVPALKLASGELTNVILLRAAAATRLPLLVSTGMSTLEEVTTAVGWLRQAGADQVALLHCVSNYPASEQDANLRAMASLCDALQLPVGWSDHTPGTEIALAAVALGAAVVEKHLTLDRTQAGPDHLASLEPAAFAAMVRAIRRVEAALGDGVKRPMPSERPMRRVARRSLAAACDIPAGTRLVSAMLTALRPGTGIPASALDAMIGAVAVRRLAAGQVLEPRDVRRPGSAPAGEEPACSTAA